MKKFKSNGTKFRIIVKTDESEYKKWHSKNLLSFTKFLDKSYPHWRWMNVYCADSGYQLANYTINKRPTKKTP